MNKETFWIVKQSAALIQKENPIAWTNTVKTMTLLAYNLVEYYQDGEEAIKAICDRYHYGFIAEGAIKEYRTNFSPVHGFNTMERCVINQLTMLDNDKLHKIVQHYHYDMAENILF